MNSETHIRKEIKFKKRKIFIGIIFYIILLVFSISFLLKPDIYIRNVFATIERIQIIGVIGVLYLLPLLYSFVRIFLRKYAIRITDDFLIDNSKYESIGEIKWSAIYKVQRLKKRNIQVFLNTTDLTTNKSNLLKKFLRYMHNWNHKKSILISSAILDCSIDELFETISAHHKNNK